MLVIRGIFIIISTNVPYMNLWVIIHMMHTWSIYTHTHSYFIIFMYCLRFPPPCVVCHVLLDSGKFIRKKQQTAALIVFSAQKMRFPMKQVQAWMQKKTWWNLNFNTFHFQTINMIWPKWDRRPKISMFQNIMNYILSTSFGPMK